MPAARSAAAPPPVDARVRIARRAATTRATPARTMASTQGGVRPVVIARLEGDVERGAARAASGRLERRRLGVRAAGPRVEAARPTTAPSRTTSAPTIGLGDVSPGRAPGPARGRTDASMITGARAARPRIRRSRRSGLRARRGRPRSAGLEGLEILDLLAHPDQLDRHPALGMRSDDAALGGAVELGQDEAGEPDRLVEHLGLLRARSGRSARRGPSAHSWGAPGSCRATRA